MKVPRAELKLQTEKLLGPVFSDPELAETLVTYLDSGENMKLTSEKLFIHINTLKYRLQRISKLLNCNLKDPNIGTWQVETRGSWSSRSSEASLAT